MQNTPVHISMLLDRSGSMASIADDVVGGFNTYLDEQRRGEGKARVTLVQFDGQDPFEVLIDGEDLATVQDLDPARYQPRGNTPLLDAIGMMIAKIDSEIVARADQGLPIEDQVVMIITDGYENASREVTGDVVSDLIAARRARAWTFAFLAADEESIRESIRLGVAHGSSAGWAPTKHGSKEMFGKLSKETLAYRSMGPEERASKSEKFFEDDDKESDS